MTGRKDLFASVPAILILAAYIPLATGLVLAQTQTQPQPPAANVTVTVTNLSGGSTQPGGGPVHFAWNPDNPCTSGPGTDMYMLLGCLASYIDPTYRCRHPFLPVAAGVPPGAQDEPVLLDAALLDPSCTGQPNVRSDFTVHLIEDRENAPIGLSIVRRDGGEPEKMLVVEDDPNIQWTTVLVERANLIAKIGQISEIPRGGVIQLWVDSREAEDVIEVLTARNATPESVNRDLVAQLQQRGFEAYYRGKYIVVSAPEPGLVTSASEFRHSGIQYLSFRSMDSGIARSALVLVPPHLIDWNGESQDDQSPEDQFTDTPEDQLTETP